MKDDTHGSKRINRREILAGASLLGTTLATGGTADAQTTPPDRPPASPPSDQRLAREQPVAGAYTPAEEARYFVSHAASDVKIGRAHV